jgi:hypothetical protein
VSEAIVGLAVESEVGGPERHGDLMPRCHGTPVGFVTYT